MNQVIRQLKERKSVRVFTDRKITSEEKREMSRSVGKYLESYK